MLVACLQPQDAYGLEKLASEELAKHYDTDFGIECRIARYLLVDLKSLGLWPIIMIIAPGCRLMRLPS